MRYQVQLGTEGPCHFVRPKVSGFYGGDLRSAEVSEDLPTARFKGFRCSGILAFPQLFFQRILTLI